MIQKKPFQSLVEAVERPFGLLLIVLLAILALYPFLGYFPVLLWGLNVASLAIVAAALRMTDSKGTIYYLTLVLGLSSFTADLASHILEIKAAYPVAAALRALFMGHLIVAIFINVMKRKKVTIDAVLGACCILIMLSLAFGSIYILIELVAPGSFSLPDSVMATHSAHHRSSTEFELIYFSLVTSTTVGYGDIYPLSPPARSLATLEGLLSQLYLAIVLARLVGLEIAERLQASQTDAK